MFNNASTLVFVITADIFFESLYRSNFACWLQPPSFYWGFLLPVGLLLIYNFVVFGFMLKKVIFRKRQVSRLSKRKNCCYLRALVADRNPLNFEHYTYKITIPLIGHKSKSIITIS